MIHDLSLIERVYARTPGRVRVARRLVGRPLTLTEKILYAHYWRAPKDRRDRGEVLCRFRPGPRRDAGCHGPDGAACSSCLPASRPLPSLPPSIATI